MTPHTHRASVPGCYRCELGEDEAVEWPPFPTVLLGAGQWRRIIRLLERHDTQESRGLAERITTQINRNAAPHSGREVRP